MTILHDIDFSESVDLNFNGNSVAQISMSVHHIV